MTPFLFNIDLTHKSVLNGNYWIRSYLIIFRLKGQLLQIMEVRGEARDIICKMTDGSHWTLVKFHPQTMTLFRTRRYKEGQILKVMSSSSDEDNFPVIVRVVNDIIDEYTNIYRTLLLSSSNMFQFRRLSYP